MMEHDGFLSAIIENSTDDAPRLIYADWLEEHGQSERAEFIRVQCALAAIEPKRCPNMKTYGQLYGYPIVVAGTECGKCRWCLLTEREQALYRCQSGVLLDQIVESAVKESQCIFRRGFIVEVTLACQDWLAHREQMLRTVPLEKVTLTHWGFGPHGLYPPDSSCYGTFDPEDCITPWLGGNPPLTLEVRKQKLFNPDRSRSVEVISIQEYGLLFGAPHAAQPLGPINTPARRRLKAESGCSLCDENDPACLDFHHLDPSKKVDHVSNLASAGVSEEIYLAEIAKCKVLCSNCHRILEWQKKTGRLI